MGKKTFNIAFVWYWDKASSVIDNWRDGLKAALEIVGQEHQVDWYIDKQVPKDDYDWILTWSDAQCGFLDRPYKAKKGLFLTAMPQDYTKLRNLDVVFCESDPILEAVRAQGIRAVKAFGTDTDTFKPKKGKKDIEYFYPATFSPWKQQRRIASLVKPVLFVGTVQPDGKEDYEAVKKEGRHTLEIGYFPVEKIVGYYQRAKKVVIPAIHGSERTALEAMACGIEPIVFTEKENPKLYSYIKELKESGLSPREFVLKNYSHKIYAEKILGVINE